jgi:hypothetical protein
MGLFGIFELVYNYLETLEQKGNKHFTVFLVTFV